MAAKATRNFVTSLLFYLLLMGNPCTLLAHESAEGLEKLVLGVHPFLSGQELQRRFTPLARYLAKKVGKPVEVVIASDYQDHIGHVGGNRVDIAYMGPVSYVQMVNRYGERPLLARLEVAGLPTYHGVIFSRADSPVHTLKDLAGRRFAFGSKSSTMSYTLPLFEMMQQGMHLQDLSTYSFLGSHKNVALAVLSGHYDAGSVKAETFEHYRSRGLREIASTQEISEHLFVARNGLPPPLLEKLRTSLLDLGDDEQSHAILQSIRPGITGLVAVKDEHYNNLRAILQVVMQAGNAE